MYNITTVINYCRCQYLKTLKVQSEIGQYTSGDSLYQPLTERVRIKKRSLCYDCGWCSTGGSDAAGVFEVRQLSHIFSC